MRFAAVLFLLATNALAFADFTIPSQKIVGAEKPIELGELASLALSPKIESGDIKVAVDWQVYDGATKKVVQVTPNGVFFGTGLKPKKLLAVCSVGYMKGTEIQVKTLTTVVTIGDVPVDPSKPDPVKPDPVNPDPVTPVEDPIVSALRPIYGALGEANKVQNAKALAQIYREGSKSLIAGNIATPSQLFNSMNAKGAELVRAGVLKSRSLLPIQERIDQELQGLMPDDNATLDAPTKTKVGLKLKVIADALEGFANG